VAPKSRRLRRQERTVISLFSGALGLDLGLEQSGFNVRVAVECNAAALATIRMNRPDLPVIANKLEQVPTREILRAAGLKAGEATVVTGGPSCQPFSTAGRRGSVGDPRGIMFREFFRVVREARPRFFVMENVTGVLSAAVRHRPLRRRGPGFPTLREDEQLGSALLMVLRELQALGYYTVFTVLNAADFGVPQRRERVLFIGSRDGEPIEMPEPTHGPNGSGGAGWCTLRDALAGLVDPEPRFTPLSARKRKYIEQVPEGGNWRDLPARCRRHALGGAYISWGGRSGFYRRLGWDKTPPALTTRPDCKATMLCHPSELRPLSVREYARIQQFPDDWRFVGTTAEQYKQLGNAFPLGLGAAIGNTLRRAMRTRRRVRTSDILACASEHLLHRLAAGYHTRINPPRMRRIKNLEATRRWGKRSAATKKRKEILDLVIPVRAVTFRSPKRAPAGRRGTAGLPRVPSKVPRRRRRASDPPRRRAA
jgi:DNA (cytosine-5)-methyltransferase 1